jgi:hypothetical protein
MAQSIKWDEGLIFIVFSLFRFKNTTGFNIFVDYTCFFSISRDIPNPNHKSLPAVCVWCTEETGELRIEGSCSFTCHLRKIYKRII